MATPDILKAAAGYRQSLLERERGAATELVRYYGASWERIRDESDRLIQKIEAARAAGEEVRPSWLFQRDRLAALQRQVELELREFARHANTVITEQQRWAVEQAGLHAEQLVLAGFADRGIRLSFNRLPVEALEQLIGFTQRGSPLRDLLDEMGPSASAAIRQSLITGLALGKNPRDVARDIRRDAGMELARALRISRTEMLRAYREAARQNYRANSDIVDGWIWHSALDDRTCEMCWAMHGTLHSLDEVLDDHPNGRCAAIPVTRTWNELGGSGFDENAMDIEPGEDVFARLPAERQLAILGSSKYAAYQDGAVTLSDFVGQRYDRRWGSMRYARSLREVLGEGRARQYQSSH